MADEGIHRKTEKRRTEIASRVSRLGLRERTMQIMVDDKTTHAGLLAKNVRPTSEGILNSPLADGYIEITSGTGAAVATPSFPCSTCLRCRRTGRVWRDVGRRAARSVTAVRVVLCLSRPSYFLGPGADDLTSLVETRKGVEGPTTRLQTCRDIIQAMAGRRMAEEFWVGTSARLPKAWYVASCAAI